MSVRIIKPGILTTVQDLGRADYRSDAVPLSGAMDKLSARLANIAIGNDQNQAVMEFTYGNASFLVEEDLLISYSGCGAVLRVKDIILPANKPLYIPNGTLVDLKENIKGTRTYLAIAGGINVTDVLGSKSTYLAAGFGGYGGRALIANDVVKPCQVVNQLTKSIFNSLKSNQISYPEWSISDTSFSRGNEIRVVPGQEFLWFDAVSIISLLTKPFVPDVKGNRMGIYLDGPLMTRRKSGELLSTAVTTGTIQVTGDGKLILLMADAQTTGGYPRIAQVAAVDLHICAQLRPKSEIYFKEISSEDAERLYLEREIHLRQLTATIAQKFS